jgi:hypothetical protein
VIPGWLPLVIGVLAGTAVTLLAESGLFLYAGHPAAGFLMLGVGLACAAGALWSVRRFHRLRRSG